MIGSTNLVRGPIVHIVFRFDYGGLENGVVNIVNALSGDPHRHVIIALTEATDFRSRLHSEVSVIELRKRPGKDFGAYIRLFRILRELRPDVVHTRNIGTLDCAFVAFLARVPVRIHGEHGWDVHDPNGTSRKHRLLRRALSPFVSQFVTVSEELATWLNGSVGLASSKITPVCNGVDSERFKPGNATVRDFPFSNTKGHIVAGSVTRFSEIKDPLNLIEAFINLKINQSDQFSMLRLVMIGDGNLRSIAMTMLEDAGLSDDTWLPGSRDDIPEILRLFDVFVLGSYREGISNTILEAMSSGLPVIASDTGGNPELIDDGENGVLVPPADRTALAGALAQYVENIERRRKHGESAREKVISKLSLTSMIERYRDLYDRALAVEDR